MTSHQCFFFNDTAPTEIYTLSLHDALPIFHQVFSAQTAAALLLELEFLQPRENDLRQVAVAVVLGRGQRDRVLQLAVFQDRKSTRLNSSHQIISYAVFCLTKKKKRYNMISI